MALKPCGECGTEISTRATSCPQCGCPQSKTKKPQKANARIQGCGIAMFAAGWFTLFLLLAMEEYVLSGLGWFGIVAGFLWYCIGRYYAATER